MCFLFVAWSEWLAPKLSALDRKEGENVIKYVRPPLELENRCPELDFWATNLGLGAQRRGSARRSDWKKNWARTLRQADGRSIRPFSGLCFFFFSSFFWGWSHLWWPVPSEMLPHEDQLRAWVLCYGWLQLPKQNAEPHTHAPMPHSRKECSLRHDALKCHSELCWSSTLQPPRDSKVQQVVSRITGAGSGHKPK